MSFCLCRKTFSGECSSGHVAEIAQHAHRAQHRDQDDRQHVDAEIAAGVVAPSYSCRYQSVIGTGRIGEVTDMEEKKQALAAIMAHYEPEKSFVFTDEQAQHVAVFRLDVAELTCKERS